MHVVYSFDTGGLENGIVNLVNHLPVERFRHAIVALTRCTPRFASRILRDDVQFIDMHKPPGHAFALYPALYRLFRQHRPAIVHTRNLAALETQLPACLAGVPGRIHGEHGWDVSDPDGSGRKNRILRRLYRPFVQQYVALSAHIAEYLQKGVGVPAMRINRICNGVDIRRFHPVATAREPLADSPFNDPHFRIIGTVGRVQAVKNQLALIRAFAALIQRRPASAEQVRLMIVGDGPLRETLKAEFEALGLQTHIWLAGERSDVPEVMRAMDVFVLPSLAEGISNTILEAMASGLPVIASDVGGNAELVDPATSGALVPPNDHVALVDALETYALDAKLSAVRGAAARTRATELFSIEHMVSEYDALYRSCLAQAAAHQRLTPAA